MYKTGKRVLCYHSYEQRQDHSNYVSLIVHTFYAEESLLSERIEGTIDNKAGYGSPEAAQRLGAFFRALVEAGHDRILDRHVYSTPAPAIRFKWLILPARSSYPADYSDCDIALGDTKLMDTLNGAKFVKGIATRIGRARAKERGYDDFKVSDLSNNLLKDPVEVMTALHRMGAKKVKTIKGPEYMSEWVYDPSPRPWMLTDTLWRTFRQR